jgi:putative zinc finger/helix-turn-helix YgiT family protein
MREINCPNCGKRQETISTDYNYAESGLENVCLKNVEVLNCSCGENFAFIKNSSDLDNTIAKQLLIQNKQLTGKEIRFLRKNLGLKSKDFAEFLGVDNVTVSRWERGEERPHLTTDKFIRLSYANIKKYKQEELWQILNVFKIINRTQEEPKICFQFSNLSWIPCNEILPIELPRESCNVWEEWRINKWLVSNESANYKKHYEEISTIYSQVTNLLKSYKYEEALKNLGEVSKFINTFNDEQKANHYTVVASIYSSFCNYIQSINNYNKALRYHKSPEIYFCRGIAYHKLNKNRKAIGDIKKAADMGYKDAQDYLVSMKGSLNYFAG